MPMPEFTEAQKKLNDAFVEIGWLLPLVGAVEIVGGLLFIFPKTRALGAIVILPVMVGIIIHNFIKAPEGIVFALVFAIINLWILFDNREKYKVLLS